MEAVKSARRWGQRGEEGEGEGTEEGSFGWVGVGWGAPLVPGAGEGAVAPVVTSVAVPGVDFGVMEGAFAVRGGGTCRCRAGAP